MLMNILTGMTNEAIKKMKEASPEERRNTARMAAEFLDLSTQLLRESPELRGAFARIHSEFLRYPESGETIRQALLANNEFGPGADPAGSAGTTH